MSGSKGQHSSKRRYPPDLKERAVRMVGESRKADPADHAVAGL